MLPPVHHYIANVLVPEELAMNLGVWGCRLLPAEIIRNYYKGLSTNLLNQFKREMIERERCHCSTSPMTI